MLDDDFIDNFPILAKRFPLGQMPTLQVDGVTICESGAINRFLANEFDLYGSNNMEKAVVDQLIEVLRELSQSFGKIYSDKTKDEEGKVRAN